MSVETIYVYLLNEGSDAWAPVQAQRLENGRFRLVGTMPDDQEWEFGPGAVVNVEIRNPEEVELLFAVSVSS